MAAPRLSSRGRSRIWNIAAIFFGLISFIGIAITLGAGTRPGVLDDLALFTVDLSGLDIASKLGESRYLTELTEVGGVDLVGADATAQTLGLAPEYSISLLARCSHGDGSTSCTSPEVGYAFDPRTVLRLDSTAISDIETPEIDDGMQQYERASLAMGVAYIISAIFVVLGPLASSFSSKIRMLAYVGGTMVWLATILLLAADIVGQITAKKVSDAISNEYGEYDITSETGLLLVPAWVAFAFALCAAIVLSFKPSDKANRAAGGLINFQTKSRADAKGVMTNNSDMPTEPKPGLMKRIQTWKDSRYQGLRAQTGVQETGRGRGLNEELSDDEQRLVPRGEGDGYDSHRSDSAEPTGRTRGDPGNGDIAMMPLNKRGQQDMNLAYEPYSSRY